MPNNSNEIDARERLVDLLARSHDDFDLFNTCILNRPPYHEHQKHWCRALHAHRAIAVETGNMLGKSWWVAGIILAWLFTRKNSRVICTGPGQSILGSVTWAAVRSALEGCKLPMGAKVSAGIKTSPHTVTLGSNWVALGFSTNSVERASGQHSGQLLAIVEEASGVDASAWEALESLGYERLVAIGNPLRAEGGFVSLCNRAASDRAKGVPIRESTCHINVPSTASPHATWDKSPVGLADRPWLDAAARQHGTDSLFYRAHVLAIRPTLTNEQLIPDEHLDRCVAAETLAIVAKLRADGGGGVRRISCDVGEGVGNSKTVIFVVDDLGVLEVSASRFTGPRDAAETMVRLATKHGVKEEQFSYDGAGQTGKRMGNSLASFGYAKARAYFGSNSGGKRCTNLRTACAMALARRLDPDHYRGAGAAFVPFGINPGVEWASMREELLALRYRLSGDQSQLEAKSDLNDRLGHSADFADSIAQCWRAEAVEG